MLAKLGSGGFGDSQADRLSRFDSVAKVSEFGPVVQRSPRSRTSVGTPAWARRSAVTPPPKPVPMTTARALVSLLVTARLLRRRACFGRGRRLPGSPSTAAPADGPDIGVAARHAAKECMSDGRPGAGGRRNGARAAADMDRRAKGRFTLTQLRGLLQTIRRVWGR